MAFVETRWSLVLRAGLNTAAGREALDSLCQEYSKPLYIYLRKSGYGEDLSWDHLQSFFAKLLEHKYLKSADPDRGRFRSFLLTALKRSVQNDRRDGSRLKRGGGVAMVSLDDFEHRRMYESIPDQSLTPEEHYHRQWALRLIERALQRTEDEYAALGKADIFIELQPALALDGTTLDYVALAERLERSQTHLRVLAHRLRRHFRRHLVAEVSETVSSPDDSAQELEDLFQALSGRTSV